MRLHFTFLNLTRNNQTILIRKVTLKEKTIKGLFWSFIDSFASQAVSFIVGIILARLLIPKEFGLIGMIGIVIAISASFINSGFSQALIRKQNCTTEDYSTVFYFSVIVASIFYIILLFTAPLISWFFKEPQLTLIIRFLSFGLIIDSLSIIQSTTLNKRIDFKLQTKISLISSIISGLVGIIMAYSGYGVWSLVFKSLCGQTIRSLLLWFWNKWQPVWVFSIKSFRELFSFGSKLLASGLLDTIYNNIYYLIIGKYFSAMELGFYTMADNFKNLPSQNINNIMSRVSYPVLSEMQNDFIRLKASYKKMITSIMLLSCILMISMATVAEPLIISLIGEKWRQSIIYLQMLSFVGMLYPLHALNLNMLQVLGRTDLHLKLEIIKKVLAIPIILVGIFFGIKALILGLMLLSIIAYYINSYWSGRFINYPMKEQISDILPGFAVAITTGIIVYITGFIIPIGFFVKLMLQLALTGIISFVLCEVFHIEAYIYLKILLLEKVKTFINARK